MEMVWNAILTYSIMIPILSVFVVPPILVHMFLTKKLHRPLYQSIAVAGGVFFWIYFNLA